MSSFVSKWVVLHRHAVGGDDLDATGVLRDDVVVGWVDAASSAYLECCPVLHETAKLCGCVLRRETRAVPTGAQLGAATEVNVSAGATEIWPTEFAIEVRLRTHGSADDVAYSASCMVSIVDPSTGDAHELGDAVRDELIALAHAAQHFN